jgi:hypothetical protein
VDLESSYEPTPRQLVAHRSAARFKLYGGAMGGGKSVWLCNSALRACLRWPGSRWYLGRREAKTFRRTTYLTLDKYAGEIAPVFASHNLTEGLYRFNNGSSIWYGGVGSAEDREKIKSMELSGFGIDEASEAEEDSFLMLATRLRLKVPSSHDSVPCRYQGLLASNPEPGWLRSRFIDAVLPEHSFTPALPRDNPHLPEDYESGLRELFEGTPAWTKAYLEGDWDAFSGVKNVIAYKDVVAAELAELEAKGDEAIGCDVARFGDDETCIGHRTGPVCDHLEAHCKEDTTETAGRVVACYRNFPRTKQINIDDDGVGGGVVDMVKRALEDRDVSVNGVHFGAAARDKEHYADWASEQLSGALGSRFRDPNRESIQIPADKKLRAQLTARLYEMTDRGQIKIESKKKMKARGLKSPDRADMLMCLFASPADIYGQTVVHG